MVRGSLCDVSRAGMGLRAKLPESVQGSQVLIRFRVGERSFTIPGDLVWTRQSNADHATVGVRLALHRARPRARASFRRWARELERSGTPAGALPAREQVECRLALLMGELDSLLGLLDGNAALDPEALKAIDTSAEGLQNAITRLRLLLR